MRRNLIILFFVLLVTLVGGYFSYQSFFNNNKDKKDVGEVEIKDTNMLFYNISRNLGEPKDGSLAVDDELVKYLYNTTTSFKGGCVSEKYYGYFYKQDSYNVTNIDDTAKIYLGLHQIYKINEFDVITFTSTEVLSSVRSLFGTKVTYMDKSINIDAACPAYDFTYNAVDKTYTNSSSCGCGGSFMPYFDTKIISANKADNKITITEKMAYVTYIQNDGVDTLLKVYKDLAKTKLVLDNISEASYSLNNNVDLFDSYQYTFTKASDNNYYFTSVKLVK